ncbi:hypothetical protein BJX99DRAFT_237879 [Aspergillus californicus]
MQFLTPFIHALVVISLAHTPFSNAANSPVLVELVPQAQSLENLAIRRNGDILTTSSTSSSLFLVSHSKTPAVLHEFPNLEALLGIAEVEDDIFYITGAAAITAPNPSNEIWKIDLRGLQTSPDGSILTPPTVSLVANDTSGGLYNGITRLAPNNTDSILLADSFFGTYTRLDLATGNTIIFQDRLFTVQNETNRGIGINGIHTYGENLYFTNTNQGIFGRVPISTTGAQTGRAEVIVDGFFRADDFALSADGEKAWVAMNGPGVLVEVLIAERTSRVVADSSLLGSASSVARGRGWGGSNLYITTAQATGNSTVAGIVKLALD